MNGKSKKKLAKITIERFRRAQTDWPTIIMLLDWAINRKQLKPNEEFHIEFRIEKEKPEL